MSESLDLAAEIGLRVRNNRTLLKLPVKNWPKKRIFLCPFSLT